MSSLFVPEDEEYDDKLESLFVPDVDDGNNVNAADIAAASEAATNDNANSDPQITETKDWKRNMWSRKISQRYQLNEQERCMNEL